MRELLALVDAPFAWVLRMDSFVMFCKGGHMSTHCIYFATLKDHFIILLSFSNEPKIRVKSCRKCGKKNFKGSRDFLHNIPLDYLTNPNLEISIQLSQQYTRAT